MTLDHNPAGFNEKAHGLFNYICNSVDDGLTVGQTIAGNYEAVTKNSQMSKNGQARGQAFELICADAIYKAVGDRYQWRGHLKCAKFNAEIDIVLHDPQTEIVHGIFLKTSFRERWKQEDRDAMLFDKQWDKELSLLREALGHSVTSFTPWALCFKEKPVRHLLKPRLTFSASPTYLLDFNEKTLCRSMTQHVWTASRG